MNKPTASTSRPHSQERETQLLQETIDAITQPVALVDGEGKIHVVNKAWRRHPPTRARNVKTACEGVGATEAWTLDASRFRQFMLSLEGVLAGTGESCALRGSEASAAIVEVGRFAWNDLVAMVRFESFATQNSPRSQKDPESGAPQSAEFEIDRRGKILEWNSDAYELFERTGEHTVGEHISVLFARKTPRFPSKELVERLRTGQPQHVELRLKGGSGRFLDAVLSLRLKTDDRKAHIVCRVDVFSERQRSAGVLRRSEERLRYALEAASDGLWDWDLKSDEVVFSPRASEIFGETPGDEGPHPVQLASWRARLHPEDSVEWGRLLRAHLDNATAAFESEHRIRTEDNDWKWVLVRGRVIERSTEGEPLRMIGTITDISDRKLAQEALRRSEQQYRGLFEHASDAVILSDPETGRIRDANEKATQLLGYSATELSGMVVGDLHPSDQWLRVADTLAKPRFGESRLFEVDGLTKDGKRVPLEINTRLVSYGNQNVYQSFIRDITERRVMEQQLRQSQKMETVGRLAGGVAHDFNNLLTAIQGYAVLLQSALPEGGEEREMTEEIVSAVQRASRLTAQLLTFSRHEIPNPEPLDLNAIVEDMEKLLRRLIGEHVELTTVLDPAVGQIVGDRSGMEQVVTNLVINGADAMPQGGTLQIRTGTVHVESQQVRPPGAASGAGDYAVLSVQDEGQGMDPETLSQVFEPFFTTKPAGSGTGLGLATVYGIVKQIGGHVDVESELGRGTTFRVYLPLRTDGDAPQQQEPAGTARTGRETVLIVEDEPAVRRLTRRFLETSGYKVVEAANVSDAIQIVERDPQAVDLLLTDVIMPELSGPELAKRLRNLCPNLKVLYMSGYPGEFISRHGISDTETAYLQKPFSQEDLRGKLRQVLDS